MKKREKILKKEMETKIFDEMKKLKSHFDATIGQTKIALEYEISEGSKNAKLFAE